MRQLGFPVLFLLLQAQLHATQAPPGAGRDRPRPVTPKRIFTLQDALDLAEMYNPQLHAAQARVAGANAGVLTARAYPNPELTFGSLGRQRAIQAGTLAGMLHGVTFTQPVELPSVRRARLEAARLGRESSQYALEENRLSVRALVKQAYFEAMRRHAEISLTRDNLRLLEDLRRRIRVQVEVGEASRLELVRAETEVAAARIQVESAELRYTSALAALRSAVGTSLGDIEPQDRLDSVTPLMPLEEMIDQALARHPAIEEAEAETRRADANLRFENALKTPQPSVWTDVLEQPDVAQYRFGISLTLPLWNRREGPVAEAVAAQRRAVAMERVRKLEITAAIERAYGLYNVAQRQVEMFEAGSIQQAEAALKGAEAAYRFGERGILEVLDAQRVLRSARMDYLNAQYDRQQALIELERFGAVDLSRGRP
jgi:cobalt-zinc-cadmium efflux system outer membrane protein